MNKNEEFIIKRRNYMKELRNYMKELYVNTSKVLLCAYHDLSDPAKITFQVIDSFDWQDKETHKTKGYAYPAPETIAKLRGKDARTIQRHIEELIEYGLITRERRFHLPSILWIEDPSDEETDKCLATLGKRVGKAQESNDKSVTSPPGCQMTKVSLDSIYINTNTKINTNVNGGKNLERGGTDSLKGILLKHKLSVPPSRSKPAEFAKRDYTAQELADSFGDQKSLGCYRTIATKIPPDVIFQARSAVMDSSRSGKIKKSKAALFVSIMQEYAHTRGIDLGFKAAQGR